MFKRPDLPPPLPSDPARQPVASYSAPAAPARAAPAPQKNVTAPGKNRQSDLMVEPGEEMLLPAGSNQVTSGSGGKDQKISAEEEDSGKGGGLLEAFGFFGLGGKRGKHKGHKHEDGEGPIGLRFVFDENQLESNIITGVGDRAAGLALISGAAVAGPARGYDSKNSSRLDKSKPASRGDCEKRCGSDGACDPASPKGCGGMYCVDMR